MVYRILVGSYTNSITALLFDPSKPSLTVASSIEVGFHPSWITPHPSDPSVIFAGLEDTVGKIVVLKYDEDGKGTIVGEVDSGGDSPASLSAVDATLLVANVCALLPSFRRCIFSLTFRRYFTSTCPETYFHYPYPPVHHTCPPPLANPSRSRGPVPMKIVKNRPIPTKSFSYQS